MKFRAFVALLACAMLMGGCAASSSNAASSSRDASAASATKAKPGDVQGLLHEAASHHLDRAARTVMPNKKKPNVLKQGKTVLVRYVDVDKNSLVTSCRPGSKKGTYVGTVEYQEVVMESQGKTEAEAKKGPFKAIAHRNMKELFLYDGKKWNY